MGIFMRGVDEASGASLLAIEGEARFAISFDVNGNAHIDILNERGDVTGSIRLSTPHVMIQQTGPVRLVSSNRSSTD